jgi:hypothetical protein
MESNIIFIKVEAESAGEVLNDELSSLNITFNAKLLSAGVIYAGHTIEAGDKTFTACVKKMFNDFGEDILPFMKCFYNAVRDWPGFNAEGMDDYETVSMANLDKILKELLENRMEPLLEIAKDKLRALYIPYDKSEPVLAQLMMAVFNEETPDDLGLNMYDRNDMEQIILDLLWYHSDESVHKWLHLIDEERGQDAIRMLSEAKTIDQIRDVIIMDILYFAMSENLDGFPNLLRISPPYYDKQY